ncbi:MAG: hypothetical protein PVJ43_05600, partial [Gemmatimonadales bacterium]
YEARPFERPDEIFALFIVEQLPPGLTGLLVAGIFAAAMSSLSSSINSLASASAYDFWAPARGFEDDDARILRVGKLFTLVWSAALIGGALVFIPLSRGTAAVEVGLGIASLVYGGLLGAFALSLFVSDIRPGAVMASVATGIATVTAIWLFAREAVAWPWFTVIGTAVTFGTGALAAALRRSVAGTS